MRSRLADHGVDDREITGLLNNDSSVTRIDITGQLSAPVSPLVVESLMRPISERWSKAVTSSQRRKFWEMRRAQPLESFVPVPQALLRCMARGWYTGQLLGLIAPRGESFEIWSRHRLHAVKFPVHLLSAPRAAGPRDHLASVLESLPVAYIEVSRTKTLDPLDSYIALRDLGRSYPHASLFTYQNLSPELTDWVASGVSKRAVTEALTDTLADAGSPTERSEKLAEFCRGVQRQYQEEFDDHSERCHRHPELLTSMPLWTGLWTRHLGPGLQDIIEAAERHSSIESVSAAPMM